MTDESLRAIVRQIAALTVQTAEALAPLVEEKQQHDGAMGGTLTRPTAQVTASMLRSNARALRLLCGIDETRPSLDEELLP